MVRRVPVPLDASVPAGRTNAYLVGDEDTLLVDPADSTDALDAAVADADVGHVAVTHTHPDHVGAVAHYAAETGATVWARRTHVDRFERATGIAPDRVFREATAIPAGDGVTVLDAPGHAPDHVVFLAGGDALCGDVAYAEGSAAVGASDGDMRAYLTALRRLLARDPERLLPGHGPVADDPRRVLHRLLAHRADRERRVGDAVRNGARTVDEILDAAYDGELGDARPLAADAVRAHLEKLAVEGRVTWDGERATPG